MAAASPQVPERLVEIKRRHALSFQVATDRDNAFGGKVGILYTANAATQLASRLKGSFIADTAGTGTWDLPQPTVLVIGRDRRVKFIDVSPDWLVRTRWRRSSTPFGPSRPPRRPRHRPPPAGVRQRRRPTAMQAVMPSWSIFRRRVLRLMPRISAARIWLPLVARRAAWNIGRSTSRIMWG